MVLSFAHEVLPFARENEFILYGRVLSDMIEPYNTVVRRLLQLLLERYGDDFITLAVFGSVARMEMRKDSDIDLLIVIRSLPKSKLKRQIEFAKIEENLDDLIEKFEKEGYTITLSPIIRRPEEISRIPPILLDMVEDAIIVYDRGQFFQKIIGKLKKEMEKLGSKRVRMGKKWYWEIKPDYRIGEVIRIE